MAAAACGRVAGSVHGINGFCHMRVVCGLLVRCRSLASLPPLVCWVQTLSMAYVATTQFASRRLALLPFVKVRTQNRAAPIAFFFLSIVLIQSPGYLYGLLLLPVLLSILITATVLRYLVWTALGMSRNIRAESVSPSEVVRRKLALRVARLRKRAASAPERPLLETIVVRMVYILRFVLILLFAHVTFATIAGLIMLLAASLVVYSYTVIFKTVARVPAVSLFFHVAVRHLCDECGWLGQELLQVFFIYRALSGSCVAAGVLMLGVLDLHCPSLWICRSVSVLITAWLSREFHWRIRGSLCLLAVVWPPLPPKKEGSTYIQKVRDYVSTYGAFPRQGQGQIGNGNAVAKGLVNARRKCVFSDADLQELQELEETCQQNKKQSQQVALLEEWRDYIAEHGQTPKEHSTTGDGLAQRTRRLVGSGLLDKETLAQLESMTSADQARLAVEAISCPLASEVSSCMDNFAAVSEEVLPSPIREKRSCRAPGVASNRLDGEASHSTHASHASAYLGNVAPDGEETLPRPLMKKRRCAATVAHSEAPARTTEAGDISQCSYPGLNIQWPYSQLILAGAKKTEARAYALGYRNIAVGNKEHWIVKTAGDSPSAIKNAVVDGVDIDPRPKCAQVVGLVTFSHSEPYSDTTSFRRDVDRHRVKAGAAKDWSGEGKMYAWHISSVRRVETPVPVNTTGQTGFSVPRFYDVKIAGPTAAGGAKIDCGTNKNARTVTTASSPLSTGVNGSRRECRRRRLKGKSSGGAGWRTSGPRGSETATPEGADNIEAATRSSVIFAPRASASSSCVNGDTYFEAQVGAWCGMHALNNFLGGPYVTENACRNAVRSLVSRLSEAPGGDEEDAAAHLDPNTGFLSIDVMNVLGVGVLGLHVEGAAVSWEDLQIERPGAAMVNWNNNHWTVIGRNQCGDDWVHTNSIVGLAPHMGRKTGLSPKVVAEILTEICRDGGAVSLHRITAAQHGAGDHYLEAEGRRAMLAPEDDVPRDAGQALPQESTNVRLPGASSIRKVGAHGAQASGAVRTATDTPRISRGRRTNQAPLADGPLVEIGSTAHLGCTSEVVASIDTLRFVSVNVAGCREYIAMSDAARMDRILDSIFERDPSWQVDALLFQEVTEEMYRVLQRRLSYWSMYRRRAITEDYFVVTAVRSPPSGEDKTTSYAFPSTMTLNGRHTLTVRRSRWTITNVHLESGGGRRERDNRGEQFLHLSRMYEGHDNQTCVVAGDFNVREGEDQCLIREGWRDTMNLATLPPKLQPQQKWTFKLRDYEAR